MKSLDLTLPTPAENLACDEALLDVSEAGEASEVLRFWEPPQHFVVVGYANKVATEVNVAACESRGVPVLRRCSGGGTVLQGPGCLNYTLVLKIQANRPLQSISAANQFIMERNRMAIQSVLASEGSFHPSNSGTSLGINEASESSLTRFSDTLSPTGGEGRGEGERFITRKTSEVVETQVKVQGHTDLTLSGLKFSGNSQRRRRHFLLFHGTFLLNFDIALVDALLALPSKQPDYRGNRNHRDFLINLGVSAASVKAVLANAWDAASFSADMPQNRIGTLVREKYSTPEWTMKF